MLPFFIDIFQMKLIRVTLHNNDLKQIQMQFEHFLQVLEHVPTIQVKCKFIL